MLHQGSTVTTKEFLDKVKHAGLKITSARQELASVLVGFSHPFTAEDVQAKLYGVGGHVHRATVYRDLLLFVNAGLLRELIIQGSAAHFYEVATHQHHHHFVCQLCLTIIDVVPDDAEAAIQRFEQTLVDQGMDVTSHNLKFYGLCPQCKSHQ